ncbi:MAG: GNAT family N-acyltransferase [Bacteroidota bacterium]
MYQHLLASTPFFEVKIAEYLDEVESALKLRFSVFNLELNEGLQSSYETGFDSDVYDTFCDHLIVKDRHTDNIVGTYRLLRQEKADKSFGFYSENEFDLTRIKSLPGRSLELGRSCVAKEYRSLPVANLLWMGIARYAEIHNITTMFGCASLHSSDEDEISQAFAFLQKYHFAPEVYRVFPTRRCAVNMLHSQTPVEKENPIVQKFPPLLKGYLRLGAMVCGEPAYDRQFGTTDFFTLVETERIVGNYKQHYSKMAGAV